MMYENIFKQLKLQFARSPNIILFKMYVSMAMASTIYTSIQYIL